jgi:hypothetical protein
MPNARQLRWKAALLSRKTDWIRGSRVNQAARSELMSVHRLIVKGLQAIGARHPEAALEYFLGDARRFSIGDSSAEESVPDLVEIIGVALSPSDVGTLVSAIERCECIALADADEELREEIVDINHRARLRLLARLPRALLSGAVPQELESWSTRAAPPIPTYGLIATRRIMCEDMEKMTDVELLAALEPFTDMREMDYTDPSGGTGHIVIQINELAAKDPAQIFRILPVLKPGRDEQVAVAGISGICQVKQLPVVQTLPGNQDSGLDVLQDVWIKVLHGIRKLKDPGSLRSWLYAITHGIAVDRIRRNTSRERAEHVELEYFQEAEEPSFADEDAAARLFSRSKIVPTNATSRSHCRICIQARPVWALMVRGLGMIEAEIEVTPPSLR